MDKHLCSENNLLKNKSKHELSEQNNANFNNRMLCNVRGENKTQNSDYFERDEIKIKQECLIDSDTYEENLCFHKDMEGEQTFYI